MEALEKKRYRTSALVWLILGMVLVVTNSASGWFFLALGLAFLSRGTDQVQGWAADHPKLATAMLLCLTLLIVLIAGALLLLQVA